MDFLFALQAVAFLFVLSLKLYGKGKGRGDCRGTDGKKRVKERKIERRIEGEEGEKGEERKRSQSETGRMSERGAC